MVPHVFHASPGEEGTSGSGGVKGTPGLHSDTLSQKRNKQKHKEYFSKRDRCRRMSQRNRWFITLNIGGNHHDRIHKGACL